MSIPRCCVNLVTRLLPRGFCISGLTPRDACFCSSNRRVRENVTSRYLARPNWWPSAHYLVTVSPLEGGQSACPPPTTPRAERGRAPGLRREECRQEQVSRGARGPSKSARRGA